MKRLMAAFASRGKGASREVEAVSLLSCSLGSDQLLAEGRMTEYLGCLRAVLACCASLPPSAVTRLLACFDLHGFAAAYLYRDAPKAQKVRHPSCSLPAAKGTNSEPGVEGMDMEATSCA